jgi:hypothetical protein
VSLTPRPAIRYSFVIATSGRLARRNVKTNAANSIAGSQIQTSSFRRMAYPRGLKNRGTAIGETRIGRHGKKYRRLSKGEKNATPSPPFVIASSTPWLALARNKYANKGNLAILDAPCRNTTAATAPARRAAKTSECVNPRCPQKSPYRIPNRNPITSRSGSTEQTIPATQTRLGICGL